MAARRILSQLKMNIKTMKAIYVLTPNRAADRFILFCAFLKCLFVAVIFFRTLSIPVNFYEIGEILLNYHEGFQRRSLIGTLISAVTGNPGQIFILIKCLDMLGIGCLLLLIYSPLRNQPLNTRIILTIIFICSPFGMSFYCDSWLKKEILFFPLLLIASFSFRMQHTLFRLLVLNGIVVTGCLIHEVFIFLGLPFLICLSYLNKQKITDSLSLALTGICSLVVIFLFSIKPEPSITNYVLSLRHLGFDTTGDLTHPLRYFRMGTKAAFLSTADRFRFSYTLMYLFLYFLNGWLVYSLLSSYRHTAGFLNHRVVTAVASIHLCIIPLFFIGLDYGRWLSYTFILSVILILNQPEQKPADQPGIRIRQYLTGKWIFFSMFFMIISIPLMATFNIYRLKDYAEAFLTFMKPF